MPTKLRFFSQSIPTWQIVSNVSSNLRSTAANTTLSTKFENLFGLEIRDDWANNPSKYILFCVIQGQAGDSNYCSELFANGTTESSTNANLFFGSVYAPLYSWDGSTNNIMSPCFQGNKNGDMRFYVKFGAIGSETYNTNFYIKNIILFKLVG